MRAMTLLGVASVALITSLAAGEPVETRGVIDAVTVYRGQALVTREVEVPGGADVVELVVTDLPARILPSSLHADGLAGLQVRSVRYRTRPVAQDVREEVRAADTKIAGLVDKQAALARRAEVINENKAYLASLQNFVAPTAQVELTRGVLNAETLEKMSDYVAAQREKLSQQELERSREAKQVEDSLALAQQEKAVLTIGAQHIVQEAVLIVAGAAKAGSVRLHYLVEGATWDPSYTARAGGNEALTLEYYAAIEQMSGEDWGQVAMTLSTATPSLMAAAPKLTSMKVSLSQQIAEAMAQQMQGGYFAAKDELARKQVEAQVRRNLATASEGQGAGGGMEVFAIRSQSDMELNRNALSMQVLDLVAGTRDDKAREKSRVEEPEAKEGLSVTYALKDRTSLPSRADRQMVQIAAMPMKATFSKVATPVLTGYVYDEARMANDSGMVLLAGPLTAYTGGAFVGSSDLPTVLVGESFVVGLGIDSSLRASRVLVDRSEQIQGGNRVVEMTYRMTLENFASQDAAVRLYDRMPQCTDGQVRVTLVSGPDLSTDGEYVKAQRKENVLRYDVKVPGATNGAGVQTVEYRYRLEYDKAMNLTGV